MAEGMKSLFLLEDERKKSAVCFLGERGGKRQSLKGSGMCQDRSFGDRYLRGSIKRWIYQKYIKKIETQVSSA